MKGVALGTPEFAVSQAEAQIAQGLHLQLVCEVEAVLWD